jgi:polar amino acid transport system substrate-binding protein
MRKIFFYLIILFILISAFGNITFKVGIYDNYPLCYYENEKAKGFYPEILNYIANKEGWNVQYIYDTWYNLYSKLQSGEIDALAAIAYSPEREKLFVFNNVAFLSNWGVLVSNHPINDLSEVSNKKIALVKGDIYTQNFLNLTSSFSLDYSITWVNSYEEVLKLISEKKVDAGVVSRLVPIAYSEKYSFIETPIAFGVVEPRIAFNKNFTLSKSIIPVIDSYLLKLKDDTTSIYWKLYNKYFVKEKLPFWAKIFLFYVLPILLFIVLIVIIFIALLRKKVNEETRELSKLNKELEKYSNELVKNQNNLIDALTLIQKLFSFKADPEEFLRNIFEYVFQIIPKADTGSIYLIENGKIRFVVSKGHDIEKLNKLSIKREQFIIPDKVKIVPGEEVVEYDKKSFSQDEIKVLFSKPLKQMMLVPLKISEETIGAFSLEISSDNPETFNETDKIFLDSLSKIISIFYTLQKYSELQGKFLKNVALALVKALETHDPYTKGHSERVAYYASKLAEKLGLDKNTISKIYWSGILHDIGKLIISSSILNKPGKLTDDEYEIIKNHTIVAYEMFKDIENFGNIPEIIRYHHERWDGKGYPDGLKGEEIPLEARILAIADAFDAMTSNRPYRTKLTVDEAINQIIKYSGKQFDPELAKIFVEMLTNNPEIILEDNKTAN